MRVWQKIYLVTLVLFLVMLNAGLFLAARFIFVHNMALERKQGETDCYFLCQNLEHDFSILERNGRYQEEIIQLVLKSYQSRYEQQNISVTLEKTEETEKTGVQSNVSSGGRRMQIIVRQNLSGPYQEYRVIYRKELKDFEEMWLTIKQTFALISLIVSLLLCLMLYILMQHILKPLDRLNLGVAQIASGHYAERIACSGKDEMAELSENINRMSDTIQSQITALEEENAKKQQLMDNMAHELRTPLTSIYGYAEYLQRARTSESEQFEGLSYIMSESRRLAKMSETMLSMRLYDREQIQLAPIEVVGLTEHVQKILAAQLQEKEIILRMNHVTTYILGEEELLVNLFRNLLENAIRASYSGGVIEWNSYETEEEQIFEIIDHGIGMEKEELDKITEAFYRVDKARSRREGGAGLGLSVAGIIVKKMNGSMKFTSEPGAGTKVTLFLQLPNNMIKSC